MVGLAPASVLAGYRIESVLGEGGMGVVYRAWHLELDRPVALKVIADALAGDEVFRTRFKREALAAAAIDHPNVVPVYEAGEADGRLFIAMRLVHGEDLASRIAHAGPLRPDLAVPVIGQIAAALDAAHGRGLLHRDVKPGNVLIDSERAHAYLTDFGVARNLRARTQVTKPGVYVGTVDYLAPEVVRGESPSVAVDVYALGCMLFETLTGQVPFVRDDELAVVVAHRDDPPPRLTELVQVGDDLQAVVDRALAKDPDDRFATAGELASAAASAIGAEAAPKRPPRPTAPSGEAGARRAGPAALVPPSLARHVGSGLFVGRTDELEQLASAWRRAKTGELTAVLVSGEPGIGKTRLVAEFARQLASDGARILYARADEEVAPPFGPVAAVLRQIGDTAEPDLLDAHVARHGGEIGRLVPELSRRAELPAPRTGDPETERLWLREAAVDLLAASANRRPAVMILDDLHWADRASLGLLLHLLRGNEARLLVLATYRDSTADHRPPLRETLADLAREPRAERLEVSHLAQRDVAVLAGAAFGRSPEDIPEDVVQRVFDETQGNALFATELLRHVAIAGSDAHVPPTVRELLQQRLARLDPAVAEMVVPAAMIGQTFELELLTAVAGRTEDVVLDALDVAREAALVGEYEGEPVRFFFRHALIQAALADTLAPSRRRRLHRRIAEQLDGMPGTDMRQLGDRARHWAEAGDNERALPAALEAGDAALDLLAPEEAVRWYRHALTVHESASADASTRAEVLIRLGEAERRAGIESFRDHLLEAGRLARNLGDSDRLARAALANNRGMQSHTGAVDHERLELLEAALDAPGVDDRKRALLLATTGNELWSADQRERMVGLMESALELARTVGDERVLAQILYRTLFAISEPATLKRRLELSAELVQLTDRLGDPLIRLLASVERSRAAMENGDLDEALLHAHRQAALTKECGDAYGRQGGKWAVAWPLALAGRYDEAQQAADAALAEAMGSSQPDALAFYGAQISVIWWDQGKLGELADGILMQAESPDGLAAHHALGTLALAEAGRFDEARARLASQLEQGFPVPVDTIWLVVNMLWGEAIIACRYEQAAALLLERILPWRDQVGFTGLAAHGAAARVAAELAALLGREDTDELFQQAEQIHERIEAPAFLARTRAGWARCLRARGDIERAEALSEGARLAAQSCGCPHLAEAQ